jgi:signal transduction histidine kinase
VARHAGATQVEIALTAEDSGVTLRVQDNGRGMTDAERDNPAALGLLGMRERAALVGGEVCFTRGSGHGTIVTVRLPQHGRSDST